MGRNKYIDRTGEERVMKNGQKATIIYYNNSKDMDIQFEDGKIVENVIYQHFVNGSVKNPNYVEELNEWKEMKNGQKARVIAYRGVNDVDIEFEDNTVVKNRSLSTFRSSSVRNPNYNSTRLGEERIMRNGQKAKIVGYRTCKDIDIEFEDGTKVEHKTYQHFKQGFIYNPNCNNSKCINTKVEKDKKVEFQERFRMLPNADIEFEDGAIVDYKKC